MKFWVLILLLFMAPVSQAADPVQFSQETRDGQDGLALIGPAMGMLQIPLQMLGGNAAEAQNALNANLTQVKTFLAKNPDSPLGLYLKGSMLELVKEGSGAPDFKKLVKVTSTRMEEEPSYAKNYEMRAKGFEALGYLPQAKGDLTHAIKLTTDPKKKAELSKDLADLGKN